MKRSLTDPLILPGAANRVSLVVMNTREIKQRMMEQVARHLPGNDGTLRYMRVEGDYPQVFLRVAKSAAEQSGCSGAWKPSRRSASRPPRSKTILK